MWAFLPGRFVFHCLYNHTYTSVSSSSAGVAVLVRRDSELHIGDFTHHLDGRAIVLEVTYYSTPVQIVKHVRQRDGEKIWAIATVATRTCRSKFATGAAGRRLLVQSRVVSSLCICPYRGCPCPGGGRS